MADAGDPSGSRPRRPHVDPDPTFERTLAQPANFAASVAHQFERFRDNPPTDEIAVVLADSNIVAIGQMPYSSNAVFLVELDAPDPYAGDQRMRGIYKPARGERPLWDFPRHSLAGREVASYLVDAALGLAIIPTTTLRDGPHGIGSVQLFIHQRSVPLDSEQTQSVQRQLVVLAALDVLLNNADRKRAHLLVDSAGHLWGIDNALTFLPYPRQRTALLELGGDEMPESVIVAMRSLRGDRAAQARLRDNLDMLVTEDELKAFWARLEELCEDPTFPVLDPWDGRPFDWF